jgi:hypothetical protein
MRVTEIYFETVELAFGSDVFVFTMDSIGLIIYMCFLSDYGLNVPHQGRFIDDFSTLRRTKNIFVA